MKALLKLCTVLTVLLVLDADYVTGKSNDSQDYSEESYEDESYEVEEVRASVVEQRQKKTADARDRDPAAGAKRRAPTVARGWTPPPPNSEQEQDEGDQLPDNVRDAARALANRAKSTTGRRCVDLLNCASGTLRYGGGLASNLFNLVRKQAANSRAVANQAFEMINELGDTVADGTVRTMQAGTEVCREGACQAGVVRDAAKEAALRLARMGGAAAAVPLSIGGNVLDVGRRVMSLPRAASQKFADTVTDRLLPKLGLGNGDEDGAPKKKRAAGRK